MLGYELYMVRLDIIWYLRNILPYDTNTSLITHNMVFLSLIGISHITNYMWQY